MIGVHAFWLLGMLGPLLLVGLIVLVVWAVTRQPQRVQPTTQYGPPPVPQREAPIDILQRRFASGEIGADEYQKARDLLKEKPPGS